MKKNMSMFLIILINMILQVSLYNFLNIFGVIPNIALILLVVFSLFTNDVMGGLMGLFTGILYDVLIMDVIGINTLIYFIVGVTLGSFSYDINRDNKMIYVLCVLIASIFYHLATFFILFFLKVSASSIQLIANKIILQIILNAIFTIIIYRIIKALFNLLKIKLFDNYYGGE